MNILGKTSSTLLLKQPNSLDVDVDQLRKTKSAENIACPQIIIDQVSLICQQLSYKYGSDLFLSCRTAFGVILFKPSEHSAHKICISQV